jgi:signal transduction histidine kinase
MNTTMSQNTTGGPSASLINQLARRVSLLSVITLLALALAAITGTFGTLLLSKATLQNTSTAAARRFDLFLASLESDLKATASATQTSQSVSDVFRSALDRWPSIFELSYIDPKGLVLAQRQRVGAANLTSVAVQPWLSAVQSGAVYVSPVDEREFGVPFVDIAIPVADATNNFQGTLVAKIDLSSLWSEVVAVRIGQSGYAYLTDENGQVLVYRDLRLVQSQGSTQTAPTVYDLTGNTPQIIAGSNFLNVYRGLDGQLVVGLGYQLSTVPWFALVEQPLSEALQGFFAIIIGLLAAFLVVVALVYSIVRFTRSKIVTPILALRDGVNALRAGNLEQRIDMPSSEGSEIGALAEAFNEMAERVETRTRELVTANALAKESTRLKSEFMATMSHELRTPLNAMLGFSGILLEGMGGELDDEAKHMVERIDSNSRRLLSLINDVLDIAKIEAGRMEMVYTPVAPGALARQWKNQMSVLAERKGLEFEIAAAPSLPPEIYADQERLSQVAINLLSNAFKFTEKGCVKLAMRPEGASFVLEVSDTGIGIPPHALNYIFDEFRQLDGSSRRAYGGSGLGLAIVRNLCRMMDGSIRVVSTPGEGSTFIVTLPLKPVLAVSPEYA